MPFWRIYFSSVGLLFFILNGRTFHATNCWFCWTVHSSGFFCLWNDFKRKIISHRFWRISDIHHSDYLAKTFWCPTLYSECLYGFGFICLWSRYINGDIVWFNGLVRDGERVQAMHNVSQFQIINKCGSAVDAVVSQKRTFEWFYRRGMLDSICISLTPISI